MTGSDADVESIPSPLTRVHITTLRSGIQPSPEFAKKGLASYAVNVGTKCGHDCTYCSTGTMLRMHPSFKEADKKPFDLGYAIVDPSMPDRVSRDAESIKQEKRGLVQPCTTTDAWAPEAQAHELGGGNRRRSGADNLSSNVMRRTDGRAGMKLGKPPLRRDFTVRARRPG